MKVKIEKIDIPVGYAAAFEGERVRKDDMQVQFGYKYSDAVEFVHMVDGGEIQDGEIQLNGPDIDSVPEGGAMPLSIEVLVAGRKMQRDFEGILERQIHRWLSHAMGFMHTGQRDQIWCRISKKAFQAGLRLKHLGTILYAKLHGEYGGIVDKVAVRIDTLPETVQAKAAEARKAFDIRDDRIAGMTDESVETFYSCTICQSYAPDHVCVITPQRLGLCGAYNWLDGRANFEINPTGPNQPIAKGRTIDAAKGEWEGVNRVRLPALQPQDRAVLRLQPAGIADDELRLLRVHRGGPAVGQRRDGRQPRIPGHDALRNEFRRPGLGHGRRGADARLRGRGTALSFQPEVPGGRRRREAAGVDAKVAQGRHPRAAAEGGPADRRAGPAGQDRHGRRRNDRGRGSGLLGEGRPSCPFPSPINIIDTVSTTFNEDRQMALTGLEIYKHLPKTNCKDCGFPTCLAFAMKMATKQVSLDKCPHVTAAGQGGAGVFRPPAHPTGYHRQRRCAKSRSATRRSSTGTRRSSTAPRQWPCGSPTPLTTVPSPHGPRRSAS